MHKVSLCGECKQSSEDNISFHRSYLPLPDEVTATVVEVNHSILTGSLLKRKPFLSHLPIGTNVSFAEIDFYSGGKNADKPMLSKATLKKFQGDISRRQSDRIRLARNEK